MKSEEQEETVPLVYLFKQVKVTVKRLKFVGRNYRDLANKQDNTNKKKTNAIILKRIVFNITPLLTIKKSKIN